MKSLALLSLVIMLSPSYLTNNPDSTHTECMMRGKVKDISPLPEVTSGYLETWVKIVIVEESGSLHDAYIRHMENSLKAPTIGNICSIFYHKGDVKGVIGNKTLDNIIRGAIIVDKMSCGN